MKCEYSYRLIFVTKLPDLKNGRKKFFVFQHRSLKLPPAFKKMKKNVVFVYVYDYTDHFLLFIILCFISDFC